MSAHVVVHTLLPCFPAKLLTSLVLPPTLTESASGSRTSASYEAVMAVQGKGTRGGKSWPALAGRRQKRRRRQRVGRTRPPLHARANFPHLTPLRPASQPASLTGGADHAARQQQQLGRGPPEVRQVVGVAGEGGHGGAHNGSHNHNLKHWYAALRRFDASWL